jgi:hypothetical protein
MKKGTSLARRLATALLAAGLAFALCIPLAVAEEDAAAAVADEAVSVNVIVGIDADTRVLTLKDFSTGEEWTYTAGPEVRNFDQLVRGDIVIAEYFAGVAVAIGPEGSGLEDRISQVDVERAAEGEKPGGSITASTYVQGVIVEVDAEDGIVAVRGPERTLVLKAGDDVDLADLAVGQTVEALFVESLSISVEAAPEVSGTLTMKMTAAALGVGVQWGDAVLTMYDGTEHEFKVTGLSLLDVGVTTIEAEGEVYRLVEASDLEGTFFSGEAGAALVGGGNAIAMKNTNGVVVKLTARQQGVRLTLAAEGVKFKMK